MPVWQHGGKDCRRERLLDRKQELRRVLNGCGSDARIQYVDYVDGAFCFPVVYRQCSVAPQKCRRNFSIQPPLLSGLREDCGGCYNSGVCLISIRSRFPAECISPLVRFCARSIGVFGTLFLRLASSPEYRLCGRSLRTAMPSAFFCPISTSSRLPRVIPV